MVMRVVTRQSLSSAAASFHNPILVNMYLCINNNEIIIHNAFRNY